MPAGSRRPSLRVALHNLTMTDRLIVERNLRVPMRDGVTLATDVIRPATRKALPAIVKRTPYDRTATTSADYLERVDLALRGYAVVDQDVRGRYASDGVYDPFHQEVGDGYDTVEWAAAQAWSNGRVGMHGASYHGATQWLAAVGGPPHLRAFVPNVTSADYHEGWAYQGGAFQLGFCLYWAFNEFTVGLPGGAVPEASAARIDALDDLVARYRHRPLVDHPALARWAPWFVQWAEHTLRDAWWQRSSPRASYEQVAAPSLNIGGWYDIFVAGTVENFAGVRARGATSEAREGSRLVVGPWSHRTIFGTGDFQDRRFGARGQTGFVDLPGMHLRWFDRWLRDGPAAAEAGAAGAARRAGAAGAFPRGCRSSSWAKTDGATATIGRCRGRPSAICTCIHGAARTPFTATAR